MIRRSSRTFGVSTRTTPTGQERLALLNCQRLPGRLNTSEVAVLLGFQEHDIGPLIAAKLLIPLGKPAFNSPKYFAAVEILELANDLQWRIRATKSLARYWQLKNRRKRPASLPIRPEAVET
jgi:hypothetical protein